MKPSYLKFFVISLMVITGCESRSSEEKPPNIVWFVAEDLSPYLSAFGDSTIETPNLSRLANEGVVYPSLFSPSGVCAPSRAAIITGMYPSGIGANHMRTNSHMEITGLPAYEAVPPPEAKMFTEYLREAGYFTTNNAKQDYQFNAPVTGWDQSGLFAHWRNREKNQPFFSVFNFIVTHESGLFEPYGMRKVEQRHYQSGDTSFVLEDWNEKTHIDSTPVHVSPSLHFPVPPYLPDTDSVQRDLWKMYNNIAEMDRQIGAILDQLEQDDLLDNTIIFFYGDHGGPLPRQKRLIYDSGLNTPMIIRFPDTRNSGTKDSQLISFIDFAPTVLSLAGIKPKNYMQGRAFLGTYKSSGKRTYIHAAVDRLDGYTDAIRAVRDDQFKYIRNYHPELPYYQPIGYREQIPTMRELLRLNKQGKLNEAQSQWFRQSKPVEELFDLSADPHELNNIADQQEYQAKLAELSNEMDRWLNEIDDDPTITERELLDELWQGREKQPVTANPVTRENNGQLQISCPTPGASLGYKILSSNGKEPKTWSVYESPFNLSENQSALIQAHRIGYKPSETITYKSKTHD